MNNYTKELQFAKELALVAGEIMQKYFRNNSIGIVEKSDKTLVTKADTEINQMVVDRITQSYPDHSIWGEEQSILIEDSSYTWVCDPVDGTMPFAKGLPISTFSIALVNNEGNSVVGVIYDPYQKRMYEAAIGGGAFLNENRIHVSDKDVLDMAYIDHELWINDDEGVMFDDPKDWLSKAGAKVTTQCSAVIMGCLVAEGSFDAMIFGQGKPEDIAAVSLIVEEAGGRVTNLFGKEQRYDTNIIGAIVSNGKIHKQLEGVIRNINYTSKYMA
jgi:fructose-1,6-bisphosphatase/inositol monophosphatase family enzyme